MSSKGGVKTVPTTRLLVKARETVRGAAGADGADVLFADFQFFQERLEEIVGRGANPRERDGFADQILRLIDILVCDQNPR